MAQITTLADFRTYILKRLGYGVITVELSNDQLDEITNDCIQDFTRYMYGEGLYKDYITLTLSAGVTEYSLSGTNVEDVYDLDLSLTQENSMSQPFTPVNYMFGGDFNAIMQSGPNFSFVDYDIAMTYLKDITNRFSTSFRLDYLQGQQLLKVVPTPTSTLVGLLEVYKRETATNLYNHILVKKLAVARAKILWGTILGKYQITFPGGGATNGSEIKSDGQTEEDKVMERLYSEGEQTGSIFMVG